MLSTDNLDKKYYKIREVAEILGIPASTIIKPRRNGKGIRLYTPSDIEHLRMVTYLVKDRGLHLEAAEEQICNNRSGVSKKAEAVERLRNVRAELQRMLDAMSALR